MARYSFYIPTIECVSCTISVKSIINKHIKTLVNIDESPVNLTVDAISATPPYGIVTFNLPDEVNLNLQALNEKLEDVGHELNSNLSQQKTLAANKPNQNSQPPLIGNGAKKTKKNSHLLKAIITGGLGLLLLLLPLLNFSLPLYGMAAIGLLSSAVLWYGSKDMLKQGILGFLKTGKMSMNTLFALSTLAALSLSIAAFFIPSLPFEFETALLIFGAHHLGKHIEQSMRKKFDNAINVKSLLPKKAKKITIDDHGEICQHELIDITKIQPGDIILIDASQKPAVIPADGILLSNSANVTRTIINGNPNSETVTNGTRLFAGMPLNSGEITLRVINSFENCYLKRQADNASQNTLLKEKTDIEQWTNTITQYFVPSVLLASILTFFVALPLLGVSVAIHSAMAILVGACPCVLGVIVPVTVKVGVNKSAQFGALITSAKTIENASKVQHVIFDLNGTLTNDEPSVKNFQQYNKEITKAQILSWVFQLENLEQARTHNIGKAIRKFAKTQLTAEVTNSLNSESFTLNPNLSQFGIVASYQGESFAIGNQALMQKLGVDLANINHPQQIFFAKQIAGQWQLLASFKMNSQLRPEAKAVVDGLKAMGKTIHLCTGADAVTANAYAKQLGIQSKHVKAECNDQNIKKDYLKQIAKNGQIIGDNQKVIYPSCCMIGDAFNDLEPISCAGVGIAMEKSDALTQQAADVKINQQGLLPILHFFANAKSTMTTVNQNLIFSLIYNVAVACLTSWITLALGAMAPGFMALGMSVQSLLILANTYRFYLKQPSSAQTNITTLKNSEEIELFPSQSIVSPALSRMQPEQSCSSQQTLLPLNRSVLWHHETKTNRDNSYHQARNQQDSLRQARKFQYN